MQWGSLYIVYLETTKWHKCLECCNIPKDMTSYTITLVSSPIPYPCSTDKSCVIWSLVNSNALHNLKYMHISSICVVIPRPTILCDLKHIQRLNQLKATTHFWICYTKGLYYSGVVLHNLASKVLHSGMLLHIMLTCATLEVKLNNLIMSSSMWCHIVWQVVTNTSENTAVYFFRENNNLLSY